MSQTWEEGQQVMVKRRTWAGINRPGGHGTIRKIHFDENGKVQSLDVSYTIGRSYDNNLEPHLVEPYQDLGKRDRRRRPVQTSAGKENAVEETAQKKKKGMRKKVLGKHQKKARTPASPLPVSPPAVVNDSIEYPSIDNSLLVPDTIEFDASSTVSDAVSDLASVASGTEENVARQYILPPAQRQPVRCSKIFPITEISDHRESVADRDETTLAATQSSPKRPVSLMARSLGSGRYQTSRQKKLASGSFTRLQSSSATRLESREGSDCSGADKAKVGPAGGEKEARSDCEGEHAACAKRKAPSSPDAHSKRQQAIDNPHVSLEEVFEKGRCTASNFISEVVENKNTSVRNPPVAIAGRGSLVDARKQQFSALLTELLRDEDGMVEEKKLASSINDLARSKSSGKNDCFDEYDQSTAEKYLCLLARENKIMRSDGLVFSI